MKAAYIPEYGPVTNLQIKDLPKPEPKEGEVLVCNKYSSVNFGNYGHIVGKPFFIRAATGFGKSPKLKIPGGDISGVVEVVGKGVVEFKVGDEVMGDSADSGMAAYAEYVAVRAKNLVKKPTNLSFEKTAALPLTAAVALTAVEKTCIKKGTKVLIIGATGGVGSFAVQIAKHKGAQVTAICSGSKANYVKSLGADKIVDYKTQDFVKLGKKFDVILAIGGYRPIWDYKKVLMPKGTYLLVGGDMKQFSESFTWGIILNLLSQQTFKPMLYLANKQSLLKIKKFAENNVLKVKIDKTYKLDDIVKAFEHYEKNKPLGKIIIKIT